MYSHPIYMGTYTQRVGREKIPALAREMAQQVRAFATKPDGLSQSHRVKEESQLPPKVSAQYCKGITTLKIGSCRNALHFGKCGLDSRYPLSSCVCPSLKGSLQFDFRSTWCNSERMTLLGKVCRSLVGQFHALRRKLP